MPILLYPYNQLEIICILEMKVMMREIEERSEY